MFNEYNEPGFINYENVKIKRVGDNLFKILHGELEGEMTTYDALNMYYIPLDSRKYERPWILTNARIVEMTYPEFVEMIQEELYEQRDNLKKINETAQRRTKIIGVEPQHVREQLFKETISENELRKIIRSEIAAWLFDLFKKRSAWL